MNMRVKRSSLVVVGAIATVLSLLAGCTTSRPPSETQSAGIRVNAPEGLRVSANQTGEPAPSLAWTTPVAPVYELGPAGPLEQPATVTISLTEPARPDAHVVIATRQTRNDPWTYLNGQLSQDRRSITFETDHFSFFTAISVLTSELVEVFKTQFAEALSGGLYQNIQKPKCANEEQARGNGYEISSSTTDAIYWCFGVENGQRVLKMTSHRRYPFLIEHPDLPVVDQGSLRDQWAQLPTLSRAFSGGYSVLQSGDTITYAVDIPAGKYTSAATELDGLGNSLSALEAGISALGTIISMGKGVSGTPSKSWMKLANGALEAKDCSSTLGQSAGEVLRHCVLPLVNEDNYGSSWAVLLGPLVAAESLLAWVQSQANALVDLVNGNNEYRIVIMHKAVKLQTYTNPRFGFTGLYPPDWPQQEPSANGDGAGWEKPGLGQLMYWGSNNVLNETPQSIHDSLVELARSSGATVTYDIIKGNSTVVSWIDQAEIVHYWREWVGPEFGSINGMRWSYPASQKRIIDPLVAEASQSFRPGNLIEGG